jgi:adenosine deaminase
MAYELLESCNESNVRYVEVSFSAPDHTAMGLDFELMMKAIERGLRRGRSDFGVEADIRIDLVRSSGVESAMETLDWIENRPDGIVSIDLGGPEIQYPPEPFVEVYERAREMGLHTVAHAGESAGPSSIWGAVKGLRVERIGHGVSAVHDSALMDYLKKMSITIETCPMSNVRTRVVEDIREHPIRSFFDHGISLSVNSDDPTFFNTSMNNEYEQLHSQLGFTLDELFKVSMDSISSSFLSSEEKSRLEKLFQDEYEKLCAKVGCS